MLSHQQNKAPETLIPSCPILLADITDPATTPCGHTFEKEAINDYIKLCAGDVACPVCKKPIPAAPLNRNIEMKQLIENAKQTAATESALIEKIKSLEAQLKTTQDLLRR